MGKKGKKVQAGKPKKLTPKDVGKRLNVLFKNLEEELKGADLFKSLPPTEDCAICLVPLPHVQPEKYYQACCGKNICWACYKEHQESINKQNEEKSAGKKLALTCPFCREAQPTACPEYLRQLQARSLQNDHNALRLLGNAYRRGDCGLPKDDLKALDCFIRAVELGSPEACNDIAKSYHEGDGVAVNKERAALFHRVGVLRGDIVAHHNIGSTEYYDFGNHEIGIRHWKIAAEAGFELSLNSLKKIYYADGKEPGKEFISKEEMDTVYRSGHEAQMKVKSEEREKHSGAKKK
jgi:TPR repeat protein